MSCRSVAILAVFFSLSTAANVRAQQGHQPYAGQEKRAIKSLSNAEIADLLAGRGMGFAKAAELNGYPGPAHLLEHADALKFTPVQRSRIEAIRARMSEAAVALGSEIVTQESELDADFAEGRI